VLFRSKAGDVIVAMNGVATVNGTLFHSELDRTKAGDQVTLEVIRDGERVFTAAKLDDKHAYVAKTDPANNNETFRGKGFLGVRIFELRLADRVVDLLSNPLQQGLNSFNPRAGSFIFYMSYPFFALGAGVDVLNAPFTSFLEVQGPLAAIPEPAFFFIANILYWLFWLNLMLGTFNALPAGPLDGGQMLRTTVREWAWKWLRIDRRRVVVNPAPEAGVLAIAGADAETQEKLDRAQAITKRAVWTVGLFILGLILLPILGPSIVNLLV
jgi:membrane-associated protease RseP (regulator of RpoE activity)